MPNRARFSSWVTQSTVMLAVVAGLSTLFSASAARADNGGPSGGRIVVEGLVLWRDGPDGPDFTAQHPGSATPGVILSPEDLDPDRGFGIRIMGEAPASQVGGFLPAGWSWQVGGMFVSGIEGDVKADDPNEDTDATYVEDQGGVVSAGLSDGNSDQLAGIRIEHTTTLAGTESNWLTPHGSVMGGRAYFGSRFIQFREQLEAIAFDDFPPGSSIFNHLVDIKTRNNMYGVQLGWEGYVPLGSGVSIGGRFAGGLFANSIERKRNLIQQDDPTGGFSDEITETAFSQMLEANPKVLFDLGGGVSLSIGGTVIWLNDVSQASPHWVDMLNRDDNNIRADADVLLYGVTAGLVFKFD